METATVEGSGNGWESLRSGEWGQAKTAFAAALADGDTPAALDGLARARW